MITLEKYMLDVLHNIQYIVDLFFPFIITLVILSILIYFSITTVSIYLRKEPNCELNNPAIEKIGKLLIWSFSILLLLKIFLPCI